MDVIDELKRLVLARSAEREFQALLKTNLHLIGKCFNNPTDEYIAFSEFPFGAGVCDFVVFTDRSRMNVVVIEIKGADFSFSTEAGLIAAEINHAAKQVRDRFDHINSNREAFRRDVHDLRLAIERGARRYNSHLGSATPLQVSPLKDITWRGAVIGGFTRDDSYESRERTKLEHQASPYIRYDSWDSFIRKVEPRANGADPLVRPVKFGESQDTSQKAMPVGTRVRTTVAYYRVPQGTEGVVDEHYERLGSTGLMVAWDLPDQPLPPGYMRHNSDRPIREIIRDGFSLDEIEAFEVVAAPKNA